MDLFISGEIAELFVIFFKKNYTIFLCVKMKREKRVGKARASGRPMGTLESAMLWPAPAPAPLTNFAATQNPTSSPATATAAAALHSPSSPAVPS